MTTPTNKPRKELLRLARAAIKQFEAEGVAVEVHFKFTCEKCGTRCSLTEPNTLYESGDCHACGHRTQINQGGFALHIKMGEL